MTSALRTKWMWAHSQKWHVMDNLPWVQLSWKFNALVVTSLLLLCDVTFSFLCTEKGLVPCWGFVCWVWLMWQWTISCSLFWSKLKPCFIQTSSKLLHSSLPVVDQLCVAKMLEHLKGCHEEYEVCQWHTCTSVPLAAKDPNLYLSYHISLFRGILD